MSMSVNFSLSSSTINWNLSLERLPPVYAEAAGNCAQFNIWTMQSASVDSFVEKLERCYPKTEYVNQLTTHSWGQKVVRFYDPDGNLIEVGTPV